MFGNIKFPHLDIRWFMKLILNDKIKQESNDPYLNTFLKILFESLSKVLWICRKYFTIKLFHIIVHISQFLGQPVNNIDKWRRQ